MDEPELNEAEMLRQSKDELERILAIQNSNEFRWRSVRDGFDAIGRGLQEIRDIVRMTHNLVADRVQTHLSNISWGVWALVLIVLVHTVHHW